MTDDTAPGARPPAALPATQATPPLSGAGSSTDAAEALVRARRFATGLLAVMTLLFVGSHVLAPETGLWGYVRAFAEAAMVGGLADWFAVTAIFRRPFGLPIPHTAVIPRSQGRIADAVGNFIAENFLEPTLVAERTARADLASGLGRWMADPAQARAIAEGLTSAAPGLLDTFDDETVAAFLKREAAGASAAARLSTAASAVLEALAQQNRHQAVLDAALTEGLRLLATHEDLLREKVRARTGWFSRMLDIDRKAADALIGAIEDLLHEIAVDPRHPVRREATELVARLSEALRDDERLRSRIEGWLREAFAHPSISGAIGAAWSEIKAAIRRDCAAPDSRLRAWLVEVITSIGAGLSREPLVRDALNVRLRALAVEVARRHGGDVSRLVSDTIRGWDTRTVVGKLEANVGRDLQFIRINGTLIGGLVGLVLHAGGALLG